MVKLGAKNNDGKPVVILGLSELNITHLKEGKPILIDLLPFGMDGQAVITYGKTEEVITQELSKVFNLPLSSSN